MRLASAVPFACAAVLLTGHLSGRILLCGGPITPNHTTRCWTQDGTVAALDSHARVVARERTTGGRFSFTLAPGRYTLVAMIPRSGHVAGGTRAERAVLVIAHRSLSANIVIPVP